MSGDQRDDRYVLVVDLGTGGPKVGFASLLGRVVHQEHHQVETSFTSDGGATQDADEWWHLILGAARGAVTSGSVDPSKVVAVSMTGQWASTVPDRKSVV